jgi:hypothetical protein
MMKRLTYTILISFLFTHTFINAQSNKFILGVNVGVQATTILNNNDLDDSGQLDYSVPYKMQYGLNLAYRMNRKIAFQTGLIYSGQGQNYVTNGIASADYKTTLNYLKIPILIDWNTNSVKKLNFILQFGFQFSNLLKAESSRARINSNNVPFGYYTNNVTDVKSFYTNTTLDVVLGPGVNYKLNNKINIGAILRMDYSLNDIEKKELKPSIRDIANNATLVLPQFYCNYTFTN